MTQTLRALLLLTLVASFSSLADSDNPTIEPRIVGGEPAQENAWPWMSALVFTYQEAITSLNVDDVTYESDAFSFGPQGSATGSLIDCGIGDSVCTDAQNKVCLIERGEINFSVKANNCEAGGGSGVIIYNNVEGEISGTLGDDFTGTIPVVAVTQSDGAILQDKLGSVATVVVEITDLAQSSSCGASFLGDKWVLTAAHCVDEQTASQIKINVGEYNLADGADKAIQVNRIYMHPDYDNVNFNNDVALLELTESVDTTAISIVDDISTANFAAQNSIATVMGWGGRLGYEPSEGPTGDFPDILHQVDLELLTNTQCERIFNFNYDIQPAMICAHVPGGGKGSCQGDSGGPVVINTNEGWQQIGIVSWGVGCASEGNPGVYARASKFIDWINEIRSGVAIEQKIDFGISAEGKVQTYPITIVNNSNLVATLSYAIAGNNFFSLADDQCLTVLVGESCDLTVTYTSTSVGSHEASIIISADNSELLVSASKLVGQTIQTSPTIATQMVTDSAVTQWFSGGEAVWVNSSVANQIESGVIGNNSESIVMMTISGAGDLSFEWSVSSEENEDEPEDPYDALYLYIDDVQVDYISGEVDFELQEYTLPEGEYKITWVYRKDPATVAFEDKGYIRNVNFVPTTTTPEEPVTPVAPVTPTTDTSNNSSGGTVYWITLFLVFISGHRYLRRTN